jgi:hypothetical protein
VSFILTEMRVSLMGRILLQSGGVLLIWLILVPGIYAYDSWSPAEPRPRWIEISGCILAVTHAKDPLHSRPPHSSVASYLLLHRQGSLVLQSLTRQPVLSYHRLWLKEDSMFARLLAEERLFVEIRLFGLLREYQLGNGILESGHIEVVPSRSHRTSTESDL